MCGRYALTTPAEVIAQIFRLGVISDYAPRWNIAPTQSAPVIRADRSTGERRLDLLRWGLVPFWAKDESIGNRMVNARSESVAQKPPFRELLERRRCIIPADAFYEWSKPSSSRQKKQPFALRLKDDRVFGFAGLWDRWKGPKDAPLQQPLESYTILTTSPNVVAGQLHDRMPVMLVLPEQWDRWLDVSASNAAALEPLLQPVPDAAMHVYPVSTRVNTPDNDDPELLREAPIAKSQTNTIEPGLFE